MPIFPMSTFASAIRALLRQAGIAVQWIPHHLLSDYEVKMTARSFMDVFPHSTLWFSPLRQNMVLIGTKQPLSIDFRSVVRKLASERVHEDLREVNLSTALDFLSGFAMGEETLRTYVGNVPDLTQDFKDYIDPLTPEQMEALMKDYPESGVPAD